MNMPDITMCKNDSCPLKYMCYRYIAKPNPLKQSYSLFRCMTKSDSNEPYCEYFKPITEEK